MRPALLLLGLPVLLAGCEPASRDPDPSGPVVAVTLPPVAAVVEAVAGSEATVRTLLPPGAHPDTYEATPRLAEALARATLVIRVGGPADAWLGPVDAPEVVLTEGMTLDGQTGPDTGNPHVWLDPILVRDTLLPRIAAALTAHLPELEGVEARARAFADSLTALDGEIRELLAGVKGRRFVAAHPAWSYFARRYGLEEVGAIHGSPGSEVGARDLARLVEETRARGIQAVIAEPQLGREGVEALADELGVRVEVADAVGGAGLEGRESYLALMRFNARAFARALGGGS